jgi:hypothetical protein
MIDRFMKLVMPEPNTGCWFWIGGGTRYGRFWANGKLEGAHNISYVLHKGEIPKGLQVCHSCDNTQCVNPDHLFLGTFQENMDDKVSKGRQAKGETAGRAKLKDDDVRVIRQMIAEGFPQAQIARDYGVDPKQITRIKQKKTWSHVV